MDAQAMSEAEGLIMQIIWEQGGAIFITDLLARVEEHHKDWKGATVRTFIRRLIDKGFIQPERRGKLCEYVAVVSRSEYLARQAHGFVESMFGGSVKGLMASLFGQDSFTPDEIDTLERYWEKEKEREELP